MNKEVFIKEVKKLGVEINSERLAKLEIYCEFLKEYNRHTNLTAIKEDEDIYLKHFYDSLTILKAIDLERYQTLLDVGSGAGFPGVVLKIFYPHLLVTLIDSNNKKTKFLQELIQRIDINIEIVNDRVENFAKHNLNKFDIVTSRAVANLRVLAEISLPLVKLSGYFVPMKGSIENELDEAKETIEIMNGKILKNVDFDLFNNSGLRNILVIEKIKSSLISDLRSYDKIIKKPLKNHNK